MATGDRPPPSDALRLRAEGVRVERGDREILRGVSLAVRGGEVLGVLGPSGAGKSTLFEAITGSIALTTGRVLLDEDDVSDWPLWRRARHGLGYVPQGASVLFDLDVVANARTFVDLSEHPETDIDALLERVQLADRKSVHAASLSGGERRRLELARALIGKPRVLILDEPFSGVDPIGAQVLGELLCRTAESGVAVIFADHHVEEALAICDRALLLLDGEVEVDSTPAEFRDDELVRGRYLGTWRRTWPPRPADPGS